MIKAFILKLPIGKILNAALWLVVVFLVILRGVLAGYEAPLKGFEGAQRIQIERGSSLSQIAHQFAEKSWISSPRFLILYGRLLGYAESMKAGEYQVEPGTSLKALLAKLKRGEVVVYQVTFVEGLGYRDYLRALANAENVVSTLEETDETQLVQLLGSDKSSPEGLFFPDTYYYEKGETDLAILKRAQSHMENVLQKEWSTRAEGLPYSSPYEALIMASIVEKESGAVAEREQIAGVFVRRIQQGMRLQTDPTIIYGLGKEYAGNLTKLHLLTPNPYNTYLNVGLPPTPIANPGSASIHAALHPADGNSLYFVARGDGSHQFSATLEEHEKAVEEFQKKRRADYRSSPAP